MKKIFALAFVGVAATCHAQNIPYPFAAKIPVTETFYNKYTVTDDYRWMEDADNPDLKKWITDENTLSDKVVSKAISSNNSLNLISYLAKTKYDNAKKSGKYYLTYAYYDDVSQPVLFIRNSMNDDNPKEIVNPNYMGGKDVISLKNFEVSADSKYLAYQYSRNGSDWAEIGVTTTDGYQQKDHLTNVKFSNIAWHGNGFFYSAYPATNAFGKTEGQTILYHTLGTAQTDDEVIFKRNDPAVRFEFLTTKDEQYFILTERNEGHGRVNYFYIDYHDTAPAIKPLLLNLPFSIDIIDSHNGKLIARNFHNADMGSIVEVDPQNPTKWRTIVQQYSESLLTEVVPLADKILAIYQTKFKPAIIALGYDGKVLQTINFPIGTSISGLEGGPNDTELIYSYQSYARPPVAYIFNTKSYDSKMVGLVSLQYDYQSFDYLEMDYPINDSVKVPMLLMFKKGLKLNGDNPTLLSAYGGFGAVNKPVFDPGLLYFLNSGGVFAYPYIRGGGEMGQKWSDAGRGINKQNSFDDFIAAADYLIDQNITKPSKLAITGTSNGGLVVAAAAIKRPKLFKLVIPVVAPLDMLRFENFTVGSFHKNEYGSVSNLTGYTSLYNYSPYNNIKNDVNYPAMLVITSANDDRVPPLHSYKFVARLQNRASQTNPVYLICYKNAGHNGVSSTNYAWRLKEKADLYGFVIQTLK